MEDGVYCPILKGKCIKERILLKKRSLLLPCNVCGFKESDPYSSFWNKVPAGTLKIPKFASIFIAILLYHLFVNT